MRLLGLVECGTHVVTAAQMGPYSESEQAMAAKLLPARLAWRVKSTLRLPVHKMLPEGSYLSEVFSSEERQRRHGQTVRVIDYTLGESATLAHFAIRQLMTQAAWQRGLDPQRLSFVHAVRVIKRKMPHKLRPFPPERLARWPDALLREIASGLALSSRGRFNPRGRQAQDEQLQRAPSRRCPASVTSTSARAE